MKRILRIILTVLFCFAGIFLMIQVGIDNGLTLGKSILAFLLAVVVVLVIIGFAFLILWLLD